MDLNPIPGGLVLASASPRRRTLLSLLGVPFAVHPAAVDERLPGRCPDPERLARDLAAEKARAVGAELPRSVVLGADTIVFLEDRVYGKPADAGDAVRMLGELAGRPHRVVTGCALCLPAGRPHRLLGWSVTTEVRLRPLTHSEIRAYVATGEPMDKAGAYAIQGTGALLVEGISGDYPNVVGLPVASVAAQLRSLGWQILGEP